MATQEPNVYAGLAVVIGGLMHARPKFFAKVMGELLFWVGEDKMLFGSDYAIWEPKWQVEGFVDWEMPDDAEFSRLPAARRRGQEEDPRPQRRQAVRRRGAGRSSRCPVPADEPASPDSAVGVGVTYAPESSRALGTVYDPELDEPITTLGFVGSCVVTDEGDVEVRLRLPTPQCAPNFAFLMAADARAAVRRLPEVRERQRRARGPLHGRGDQRRGRARGRLRRSVPGRDRRGELDALRELFQRKALVARQARLCQALLADGASPEAVVALRVADLPESADAERCVRAARGARAAARPDAPAFVAGDGAPVGADDLQMWLRRGAAREPEPRDQRRHVPRSAASSLRGGGGRMKAARLHAYHEALKVEEIDEPKITGPARRDRQDRRGRPVPHRPAHPGGPVGREVRRRAARTCRATRTPAGSTRSAPA